MFVILHNIRSLHNVGSIFRTADAAGVEKIYLCGFTPTPVDAFGRPRTQLTKVSLAAEKYVEWEYCKSSARLIAQLKKEGYKIFAIEQSKKSIPYYLVKCPAKSEARRRRQKSNVGCKKVVLVLGGEIKGLPPSILSRAERILEIPMRGKKESLNVSVAFGIIAFNLIN
ncbi:MAG: TrmH family RNA methyltransferase [Patescibacteria group bacterium]